MISKELFHGRVSTGAVLTPWSLSGKEIRPLHDRLLGCSGRRVEILPEHVSWVQEIIVVVLVAKLAKHGRHESNGGEKERGELHRSQRWAV